MTTQRYPSARRRAPRSLLEVEAETPAVLAMMTRAQVDVLPRAARVRRRERIFEDRETLWTLGDIARYFRVGRASVAKWRWRTGKEEFEGRNITILPKELSTRPQHGPGRPQPQWRMVDILNWAAEIDRADRIDYVTFPRKRPGCPPASERRVAPAQRTPPATDLAAVA